MIQTENGKVLFQIYDLTGKLIKTFVNEEKQSGYYSVIWNGRDEFGREVSSGIYFYRIQAGNYIETKQCIMLK